MAIPMYGQNKDGNALDKALNGGFSDEAGTDLADSTAAVAMVDADFGKTFWCLLDGASKTVTLPASTTDDDIGKQVMILQRVDLVASGVLTISAGTGNTFSLNSYAMGVAIDEFRPSAGNNTLTITGADSNSAWGENSYLKATVVGAGKYMLEINAKALGNGSDGIAFTTV
tara:strand:+ start:697 stop:1209 length:513 start_codon:yes stop_codon:yes gene_type:complete